MSSSNTTCEVNDLDVVQVFSKVVCGLPFFFFLLEGIKLLGCESYRLL